MWQHIKADLDMAMTPAFWFDFRKRRHLVNGSTRSFVSH